MLRAFLTNSKCSITLQNQKGRQRSEKEFKDSKNQMALGKNVIFKHKHLSAQLMHIFAALSHVPELYTVKDTAQTAKGK